VLVASQEWSSQEVAALIAPLFKMDMSEINAFGIFVLAEGQVHKVAPTDQPPALLISMLLHAVEQEAIGLQETYLNLVRRMGGEPGEEPDGQ
jgi:hypothetical protein